MSDSPDNRDFFISFNIADRAFAEAIDAALRAEGFTTYYYPRDHGPGGNIAIWMDDALLNSAQTLALFSPSYVKDDAAFSRAELYASLWQELLGNKRKLIPIILRETQMPPLMLPISWISVTGMTPVDAASHVIKQLKEPKETEHRELWQRGLPLPEIFKAAYRPNPNFKGRLDALSSIERFLSRRINPSTIAVAGMPGVGKSTLAAEYCYRFGGRYRGVWWIRAEQATVMLADLQTLGQRLGVAGGENTAADARKTLDHLSSVTEPWLLIYDNAPNADAVRQWLPAGAVRCIITSRFTEFSDVASVELVIEWNEDITADYLLHRTNRDDVAGAQRLAIQLGGLPLAAEQAASFLNLRSGITFDDYGKDISRLINRPRALGAQGEYPDTVYAAFVKSLDTVGETGSHEEALDLIRLSAFLSPDGVDLGLLTFEGANKILPASLVTAMANKFAREDALSLLISLSLLRRETGPAGEFIKFHRLLLDVVRDWIGEHGRLFWGDLAVQLVSQTFPHLAHIDPSSWPICARLVQHVQPLRAYAPRTETSARGFLQLLNRASSYLFARGDRTTALELAGAAVALARVSQVEPQELAALLTSLGTDHAQLDQLDEAEEAHTAALQILEQHLAPNSPALAVPLSNLAYVFSKRQRFSDAEPLMIRAADLFRLGVNTESPAFMLANLGAFYNDWADASKDAEHWTKARKFISEALTVAKAAHGERHPATQLARRNLAVLNARQGDWAGAVVEAERALATALSLDLANHEDMEQVILDLTYFWEQSGQRNKATRLRSGDISDLLEIVAQVETEHRAWVAENSATRKFGPPSPFWES